MCQYGQLTVFIAMEIRSDQILVDIRYRVASDS